MDILCPEQRPSYRDNVLLLHLTCLDQGDIDGTFKHVTALNKEFEFDSVSSIIGRWIPRLNDIASFRFDYLETILGCCSKE